MFPKGRSSKTMERPRPEGMRLISDVSDSINCVPLSYEETPVLKGQKSRKITEHPLVKERKSLSTSSQGSKSKSIYNIPGVSSKDALCLSTDTSQEARAVRSDYPDIVIEKRDPSHLRAPTNRMVIPVQRFRELLR